MRILKTFVVLGICIVGFGFYRGWFFLESHDRDVESNKVDVTLTVDPDKVKDDVGRVKSTTLELENQATDKATSDTKDEDNMKRIDENHARVVIRV